MLRACVLDFGGSWDVYLWLVEFSYNNSYYSSVRCAPFEALYGRKYRSLIMWAEVGEGQLIGPELVQETTEKISQIKDRIKAARDCQKSYADKRRKPLEFSVCDYVLLRVSPWKGVVRFGKKGKLAPRFVGPFEIVKKVGPVANRLDLPEELNGVHDTFHVSNLKKCLADPTLQVPLDEIQVDAKLNFVEEPVEILEREFKKLKRSRIAIVKVDGLSLVSLKDVLWETISDIYGNNLQQCVGIVSDKFKSKALRNLENQHYWMVNLSCQYQGVNKLIQDFSKELPLFHNVTDNCYKVANFVNTKSQIRHSFLKHQLQEYGRAALLRVPFCCRGGGGGEVGRVEFEPVFEMVEVMLSSARALQLVFLDESYKMMTMDDQIGKEIKEMMRSQFWNELEAVHSLVRLIKGIAQEIEKEKPRIRQCLPLWEELRAKIKEWCAKFHIHENHVEKVFDKRFKRNYHPAWAAAFILDPFYLIRDPSGKYLPPFKCLTSEQEKDVDKLITRLVSREEAHIALMELMKWRTEGLDPVYAQAVQLKQRDPITGKMKIANPQSSRLVWETYLTDFNSLRGKSQ
ncbi:putative transcription factor/ chromatin remodeling BED-type(Zn) family protein [Tanacetum coccineum]